MTAKTKKHLPLLIGQVYTNILLVSFPTNKLLPVNYYAKMLKKKRKDMEIDM